MIALEYEIEKSLRAAIRTAINLKAESIAELATCRIIGFRLEAEDQTAEGQDAAGIKVMIMAYPNTAEGYNTAYALEPQRSMTVDVTYNTHPDDDVSRAVFVGLENAVRSVFEVAPPAFVMPAGVLFGAGMITDSGSSEFGDRGQIGMITVQMKLSITG
jgi:hypothetical protein